MGNGALFTYHESHGVLLLIPETFQACLSSGFTAQALVMSPASSTAVCSGVLWGPQQLHSGWAPQSVTDWPHELRAVLGKSM